MKKDVQQRVLQIGASLQGRIEQWKIDFAMEYVQHNEVPLAFQTLCSHIYEDDVRLTPEELSEILDISSLPQMYLHASIVGGLKQLVECSKQISDPKKSV